MKKRNLMLAAAGLASLFGCAHAQTTDHSPIATAQCGALTASDREFARDEALPRVARVEPYKLRDLRTRATQQLEYTAGAKLYIPAQKGWSAPYLERVLSCHAAAGATGSDPFQVAGVSDVDVETRGGHYVITIAGHTREAGRQIWHQAEALHDRDAHVEVHQLSENATQPAL